MLPEHDSSPEPLTVSYYTLTGARIGDPPRHSLAERLTAAASAGFSAVALAPEELRRSREAGGDVNQIVDAVRAHELTVSELEPMRGWEASDEPSEDELLIYELADALGAARVNTIQVAGADANPALVAERLAGVAERASAHGLTIAFEPGPAPPSIVRQPQPRSWQRLEVPTCGSRWTPTTSTEPAWALRRSMGSIRSLSVPSSSTTCSPSRTGRR